MHRLSRSFPPDKEVLKNVTLAFLPGAKIGVLGYNGAGKSTVLRIMAGVDNEYRGDAMLAPDATVGLLEQEPHLDDAKDVRGNVEDGVREVKDMLDRFNELSMNYSDETADEFAAPAGAHRRRRRLEPDSRLDQAMDALRLPPGDADVGRALGRRAPPRRALPAAAARARPPAARRAHQPPRRRVRRVARAPPRRVRGHGRRRHPRPLLPRQRRRLDPRARPRARASPTRATTRAGWSRSRQRLAQEERAEKARQRTIAAELDWVRQNPKGRQTKQKARLRNYEALVAEERNVEARPGPDPHPRRPAARRRRGRGREPAQGLRRPAAHRGPVASRCRAAASSASSAPTAPARRRCSA